MDSSDDRELILISPCLTYMLHGIYNVTFTKTLCRGWEFLVEPDTCEMPGETNLR